MVGRLAGRRGGEGKKRQERGGGGGGGEGEGEGGGGGGRGGREETVYVMLLKVIKIS